MRVIVAYDIGDDARRLRVARMLLGIGIRSQRSVFDCDLSHEELTELVEKLEGHIDLSHDVVQVFAQCSSCASSRIDVGQARTEMDDAFWVV
jgi:CRISPR-associated protein Cas2